MNFKDLLLRAKDGDQQAKEEIFLMYRPLLFKESCVNGIFDEDLFQELSATLIHCVSGCSSSKTPQMGGNRSSLPKKAGRRGNSLPSFCTIITVKYSPNTLLVLRGVYHSIPKIW